MSASVPVRSAVDLAGALRRRWWVVVLAPVLTVLLALAFVLWMRPEFEARASLRFLEERSPLDGGVASVLGSSAGASLLAGVTGQGVPIQTEIAVLSSRSLAAELVDELGLRLDVRDPARRARTRIFAEARVGPEASEGEYELVRQGADGWTLQGEVLVGRDPFRAIGGDRTEVRDFGPVAAGGPLPLEGATLVLAPEANELARIRFRILSAPDAADEVQERVVVSRPQRDADLVEIVTRWSDPEIAALLANRLTERFTERREKLRAEDFGRTAAFLDLQIDSLVRELSDAEESLRSYREAQDLVEPQAQATAAIEQLAELTARRDLVAAERQALGELLGQVRAAPPVVGASPLRRLVFFPTLLENAAIAELLRLLGEMENERASLLDRRTPDAREVQALDARVADIEGQLQQVAETYLQGLGSQVASLDAVLEGSRSELERVPAVELEYLRRRRAVETLSELHAFMQVQQKEAEVTAAGESGGVRRVDIAEVPIEPARPRPLLTLVLAMLVGLALGVGGAVAFDRVRAVA